MSSEARPWVTQEPSIMADELREARILRRMGRVWLMLLMRSPIAEEAGPRAAEAWIGATRWARGRGADEAAARGAGRPPKRGDGEGGQTKRAGQPAGGAKQQGGTTKRAGQPTGRANRQGGRTTRRA